MLGLPQTTVVDTTIPKKLLYEKLGASASLRRRFVEQVERIVWRHKIAPTTVNIAPGTTIDEIHVIQIELYTTQLDDEIVRKIDKALPYPVLFVLTCGDLAQALISYKEIALFKEKEGARVTQFAGYRTEWVELQELPCKLTGLDLDAVYENFVLQVAGKTLRKNESETLAESVNLQKQREKVQRKIDALEKKIWKEPQLNRQMEMSAALKRLKKELKELR